MKKREKTTKKNKGFTLIEVVLTMVIAGSVFLAVYALYANTISHDMEAQYEVIAANLAQEGIEIMRNLRDEQLMTPDSNFAAQFSPPYNPYMSGQNPHCDNGRPATVRYYQDHFQNRGSGGNATPFSRTCDFSCSAWDGPRCTQATAVCTVSWDSFVNPLINREVEATAIFTNWLDV